MILIRHDHGDPWDDNDLEAVDALLARGESHREIAEQLGRTPGAVRSKLYRRRRAG